MKDRSLEDTRILDWFLFDVVQSILKAIGATIGGLNLMDILSSNGIDLGQLVASLGFGSLLVPIFYLICAFTYTFPSGIKTYCQYNLIKVVIVSVILYLFAIAGISMLAGLAR